LALTFVAIDVSDDVVQDVFSTAITTGTAPYCVANLLLICLVVKNLLLDLTQALLIEPAARLSPSRTDAVPKAITPTTTFENTTFDTPFRHNSASQNGIEETHDEVDQRILEELAGRICCDVR
jgi:hypothetical protein